MTKLENKIAKSIINTLVEMSDKNELPKDLKKINKETLLKNVMVHVNPLISVLRTLREDAIMALDDSWDRSDEGFECQIKLIDEVL